MPNYKLLIEYDGTDFHGWQIQPKLRTVQGEIEHAATTFFRSNIRLHPAGRTDAGVHARGMVANFKVDQDVSIRRLIKALNGITGKDIIIHNIEIVDDEFNSRWTATAREYVYRVTTKQSALTRHFTYYVESTLDLELMQQATAYLPGSHNFRAFSLHVPKEKHYLCRVESAMWSEVGNELHFRIKANRFLHGMVRILAGTLVMVGRKVVGVDQFASLLDLGEAQHIGYKAPARGLCLEKVYFDNGF